MTLLNKKSKIKFNSFLNNTIKLLYNWHDLIVFLINCMIIIISLLIAYSIRFELHFPINRNLIALLYFIPIAIIVKFVFFYLFKVFHGLWRYVSLNDLIRLFSANFCASLLLFIFVNYWHKSIFSGIPRTVIIIDFMICLFLKTGARVFVRIIREKFSLKHSGKNSTKTLLIGSAYSINALLQAFENIPKRRQFTGIICDDLPKGKSLRNVNVLGSKDKLPNICQSTGIDEILLLPPYSKPSTLNEIIDILEKEQIHCTLRMVPDYADIADGEFNLSLIKDVEIEDLLGREQIDFNNSIVLDYVKDKNVIVTGAGGSIGSELTRQLAEYSPRKLVLFDNSEYNMYEMSMELSKKFSNLEKKFVIGDIRNKTCVLNALNNNNIEIVFHAAAYKHVPLMEINIPEAFHNNVIGSNIIADACEEYGVEKFVLISTDKAVNPTSIMGATKRLAEKTILERQKKNTTFSAVRFGNVLGSSGSVVPLFKQQIKEGGPVTVTSKNMTRYFMSIPEAVNLVLQAGSIGKHGNIMVLEMGAPMKIYDMAKKIIELSGFRPGIDIKIKITGLRPGEKEYEELLTDSEKVDHTCLDKIYTAKIKSSSNAPKIDIELIKNLIDEYNSAELRKLIKEYIPEFIG